jgi:hypothetical protein
MRAAIGCLPPSQVRAYRLWSSPGCSNRVSSAGAGIRSVFHHFPITRNLVVVKCRQFSVLGLPRGSLGSSRSAIELRPLASQLYYEAPLPAQLARLSHHEPLEPVATLFLLVDYTVE